MARKLKGVRGFVDNCSDVVTDAVFTSDVNDQNTPILTQFSNDVCATFPAKCIKCSKIGTPPNKE